MPNKVRLGFLRDMWKTVADWVKGESNDVPKVQLSGTDVPLRGLASERPTASSSNKGYVYWSVDTGDVSVSTGSTWRSLGVA